VGGTANLQLPTYSAAQVIPGYYSYGTYATFSCAANYAITGWMEWVCMAGDPDYVWYPSAPNYAECIGELAVGSFNLCVQ